jgi:protein-S-isoprenylcysteine O-methyltransferase Ste14
MQGFARRKFAENDAFMPTGNGSRMFAKLLLQNLLWFGGMGAVLFVSAGTLHWPTAWMFLGTMVVFGLLGGLWLARTDPALLAERMRLTMQPDQPIADKKFMLAFGVVALAWLVAIGLDRRLHGSHLPPALEALGLAVLLLSNGFIMWVMQNNSFAAPVVKLQSERGHRVIDSGPYAWVRHPMYSGSLLFLVGTSLLLGSWWGVAISPLFAVLFGIRTGIEERALIAGLPGYVDYASKVRYRLFPGVW